MQLQFGVSSWVGAARTRAPAATNYDVHALRREMLESPGPKCNGASSSRPSTFRIMDWPRPGKYRSPLRHAYFNADSSAQLPTAMGYITIVHWSQLVSKSSWNHLPVYRSYLAFGRCRRVCLIMLSCWLPCERAAQHNLHSIPLTVHDVLLSWVRPT